MDLMLIIVIVCAVLAVVLVGLFVVYGRGEANFTFDIGGSAPRAAGGSDTSSDSTVQGRLVGLAVAVGAVFATLVGRLWTMQLLSRDEYLKQAENNRTTTVYTQAPRGRILDRNGEEIVGNRPSLTVVASSDVLNDDVEIQLLANLIGMPAQAVRRKLQDTTEGAQSLRPISTDVSRRVVAYIGEHPALFPNVSVQTRTQRNYPNGSLAAHVVGYTGTVTDEQLKASKEAAASDGAIEYRSGDVVGQTGIESKYESVLQGTRGEQTVFVDANGNVLDYSTTIAPQAGSDLVLTIDKNIQKAAEDSLARVTALMRDRGYKAEGGSVVAVDCTNGEVIAMASTPTFSPGDFVGGISVEDWNSLQAEDAHYPMMNRVIAGQYPSGSVIKPLTVFAALDYGVANAQSSYYCNGWWSWSGSKNSDTIMKCWWTSGHGLMDLSNGITFSCDVVFYEIGKGFWLQNESEGMQDTFKKYGLGSTTGIDLPGEMSGRVPTPEWKWDYFSSAADVDRAWKGGDNCNLAIGQGDLLVTLMQMVCAYCSIANGGDVWVPHLMKGVRAAVGEGLVSEFKPRVTRTVEQDQGFRDIVATGMEGVCYRESETIASHWNNLSIKVRGKTGTAEQSTGDPIGWFIGYGPAEDPKYVIGANMDRVVQGSESAMYIVRDVFGAIYGEPDDAAAVSFDSE